MIKNLQKFTDGEFIYYAGSVLGENKFAVCKKKIGSKALGVHKYRSNSNKIVQSIAEAQNYLEKTAHKNGWQLFFDE